MGGYIDLPHENTWVERAWHFKVEIKPPCAEVDWLPSMNMIVEKESFVAVSGFNESLITCEDVDLGMRLKSQGSIFYDQKICVVHLGEAKTLKHFFLKEKWRGQSNLRGFFEHNFDYREIPSVFLPVVYLVGYLSIVPIVLFQGTSWLFWSVLSFILFVPLFRACLICKRASVIHLILPLTLLWLTYYTARGCALLSTTSVRK